MAWKTAVSIGLQPQQGFSATPQQQLHRQNPPRPPISAPIGRPHTSSVPSQGPNGDGVKRGGAVKGSQPVREATPWHQQTERGTKHAEQAQHGQDPQHAQQAAKHSRLLTSDSQAEAAQHLLALGTCPSLAVHASLLSQVQYRISLSQKVLACDMELQAKSQFRNHLVCRRMTILYANRV